MLRRRVRELEARIEALEGKPAVDYAMPPRPDIGDQPVEAHTWWRERCADYATVNMVDVEDDRAYERSRRRKGARVTPEDRARPGVYL